MTHGLRQRQGETERGKRRHEDVRLLDTGAFWHAWSPPVLSRPEAGKSVPGGNEDLT